jgi:hypothetical protein
VYPRADRNLLNNSSYTFKKISIFLTTGPLFARVGERGGCFRLHEGAGGDRDDFIMTDVVSWPWKYRRGSAQKAQQCTLCADFLIVLIKIVLLLFCLVAAYVFVFHVDHKLKHADKASKYAYVDHSTWGQIQSRWLGDIVNSGIGSSYRHARLHVMAGWPVRQPYAGIDFIPPVRDYEFGQCYWVRSETPQIAFAS